jgi:hypothetical protein
VAFLGIALGHELNMPMLDGVASIVIGTIMASVAILLVNLDISAVEFVFQSA